jgi:uncharacterized protein YjdB
MSRKKIFKGVRKGISRKLFLLAGLIILIVCFAFFACDLPVEDDITSITLVSPPSSIYAGDVDYLVVNTVPAGKADDLKWTTSNNEVISVVKGKITANLSAAGKSASITASNVSGSVTKSCSITVSGESSGKQVSSIALVSSSITMTVPESRTISHSISPDDAANKAIFWTSSAPGVAKVDSGSGNITAVSAGTAVITVTTKNKGRTATCTVTVNASSSNQGPGLPADDTVTNITMEPKTLSLEAGKTGSLKVTAAPSTATNYTVTWTSNDTTKATVDNNGLVTAVAAGNATITAQVGQYTDTCAVTVTPATSIVLNKTKLTLFATGAPAVTTAIITGTVPSGSSVTWESNNTSVATVIASSSGIGATISAVAKGTTTITATITGSSSTATCDVTVVDGLTDYYGDYSGT